MTLRKVVSTAFLPNSSGGIGGSRLETLECGHCWVGKGSVPRSEKRRCHECKSGAVSLCVSCEKPVPCSCPPPNTKAEVCRRCGCWIRTVPQRCEFDGGACKA